MVGRILRIVSAAFIIRPVVAPELENIHVGYDSLWREEIVDLKHGWKR